MFWPKIQQYRHIVPWNQNGLPCNRSIYDVWAGQGVAPKVLWAALNSTLVSLSKHQFGRIRGIEGNLQVDIFSVNMMLVPDVRSVEPEAAERAIQAAEAMSQGTSSRYLYEEFDLPDRQELDDAVLEMIGIQDVALRGDLRQRIYDAIREQYTATRQRELIAQHDRRQSQRGGTQSVADIAEVIWEEHEDSLGLLQFPEDFVGSWTRAEPFDLPDGQVEVGTAMIETGRQLRVGTIRVGGSTGTVLEVGSIEKARFLEALAECGRYGSVRIPEDAECGSAYQEFTRYKQELTQQFNALAIQRTRDSRRQRQIGTALMRKALAWRR